MTISTATARKALESLSGVVGERDALTAQLASVTKSLNDQITALTADRNSLSSKLASAIAALTTQTAQLTQANNDLAAAKTQLATAAGQIAASQAQVVAVTATNTTLTGQVSSLTSQVSALQAQVAQLLAELDALKHPTPPPPPPVPTRTATIVGASTPDNRLGPLPYRRTYSSDTIGRPPTTAVAHSFKSWGDLAALNAWVKAAPTGSVLTHFHEPEDNIETGNLTVEAWTQRQVALCKAIVDNGRVGQVRPAVILMGWSVANRPDLVKKLLNPELVAALRSAGGIAGWDRYLAAGADDPKATTGQALYGPLQAISVALGLPWGIYETGARQSKTTDSAKAAPWWRATFDWVATTENPPMHFLLWNPDTVIRDDTGATFSYDFQVLPDVVSAWQKAISRLNPEGFRQG